MPLLNRVLRLAALFFILLLAAMPALTDQFTRSIMDPDFWWHVRVGEWILHYHSVPHSAILTQHSSLPWVAYSWGFEILIALLFRLGGLAALPLMLVVFRAVIVFSVFLMTLRLSNRFWPSLLLAAAASFALWNVMPIRPILFSLLFFTIELGIIFYARTRAAVAPLYWLPLLFLLWANTHIQFIYGLFVLTLFIGCELLRCVVPPEKKEWVSASPIQATPVRLLLVYFTSLLATFVGPYWGATYGTVLKYVAWVQQYYQIRELLPMGFRNTNDYFVVLLLIAGCIAIGRRGLDLFTGSLILSAAFVTFRARRDVWFVSLVACALVAAAIAREERPERPAPAPRFSSLAQYAGVLLLAIAAAYGYAFGVAGLSADNLISGIDAMYPVRATEYVRQHHLPGPMYNTFEWGGFLAFNLREYEPSIDGRYDLYGPALCQRNFDSLNAIAWQHDPDLAKAGFVLLPKRAPLVDALAADPGYRLIYSDHIAQIFVKTSAAEHPAGGR